MNAAFFFSNQSNNNISKIDNLENIKSNTFLNNNNNDKEKNYRTNNLFGKKHSNIQNTSKDNSLIENNKNKDSSYLNILKKIEEEKSNAKNKKEENNAGYVLNYEDYFSKNEDLGSKFKIFKVAKGQNQYYKITPKEMTNKLVKIAKKYTEIINSDKVIQTIKRDIMRPEVANEKRKQQIKRSLENSNHIIKNNNSYLQKNEIKNISNPVKESKKAEENFLMNKKMLKNRSIVIQASSDKNPFYEINRDTLNVLNKIGRNTNCGDVKIERKISHDEIKDNNNIVFYSHIDKDFKVASMPHSDTFLVEREEFINKLIDQDYFVFDVSTEKNEINENLDHRILSLKYWEKELPENELNINYFEYPSLYFAKYPYNAGEKNILMKSYLVHVSGVVRKMRDNIKNIPKRRKNFDKTIFVLHSLNYFKKQFMFHVFRNEKNQMVFEEITNPKRKSIKELSKSTLNNLKMLKESIKRKITFTVNQSNQPIDGVDISQNISDNEIDVIDDVIKNPKEEDKDLIVPVINKNENQYANINFNNPIFKTLNLDVAKEAVQTFDLKEYENLIQSRENFENFIRRELFELLLSIYKIKIEVKTYEEKSNETITKINQLSTEYYAETEVNESIKKQCNHYIKELNTRISRAVNDQAILSLQPLANFFIEKLSNMKQREILVKSEYIEMRDKYKKLLNKIKEEQNELKTYLVDLENYYENICSLVKEYYLETLKSGLDVRKEGLSWIVIRLFEINCQINSQHFPKFLTNNQIDYLIEISKKMILYHQYNNIANHLKESMMKKKLENTSEAGTLSVTKPLSLRKKSNNGTYSDNEGFAEIQKIFTSRSKQSNDSKNKKSTPKNKLSNLKLEEKLREYFNKDKNRRSIIDNDNVFSNQRKIVMQSIESPIHIDHVQGKSPKFVKEKIKKILEQRNNKFKKNISNRTLFLHEGVSQNILKESSTDLEESLNSKELIKEDSMNVNSIKSSKFKEINEVIEEEAGKKSKFSINIGKVADIKDLSDSQAKLNFGKIINSKDSSTILVIKDKDNEMNENIENRRRNLSIKNDLETKTIIEAYSNNQNQILNNVDIELNHRLSQINFMKKLENNEIVNSKQENFFEIAKKKRHDLIKSMNKAQLNDYYSTNKLVETNYYIKKKLPIDKIKTLRSASTLSSNINMIVDKSKPSGVAVTRRSSLIYKDGQPNNRMSVIYKDEQDKEEEFKKEIKFYMEQIQSYNPSSKNHIGNQAKKTAYKEWTVNKNKNNKSTRSQDKKDIKNITNDDDDAYNLLYVKKDHLEDKEQDKIKQIIRKANISLDSFRAQMAYYRKMIEKEYSEMMKLKSDAIKKFKREFENEKHLNQNTKIEYDLMFCALFGHNRSFL